MKLIKLILFLFCLANIFIRADAEIENRPIVYFPGLYEGNRFIVDGPFWYDGDAVLEQYNHNQLKISINMRVPNVAMAYKVIDSKINISIGLSRGEKSKFNLIIIDIYGGKNYFIPNVRLRFGEIEGGWFSNPKDFVQIIAINQEYTFVINEPGRLSLSSSIMPGSLSLIKK